MKDQPPLALRQKESPEQAKPVVKAQYFPNNLDAKLGICVTKINTNTKSKSKTITNCKM